MKSLDYCSQEMVAPSEQQLSQWKSLVADPKEIENHQAELYDQLFGQRTADGKIQLQLTKNLATTLLLVEDASTGLVRSFVVTGASFACVKCRQEHPRRSYVRLNVDATGINSPKGALEHAAMCQGESKANILFKQLSRRLRLYTEEVGLVIAVELVHYWCLVTHASSVEIQPDRSAAAVDVRPASAPLHIILATYEERLQPMLSELVRLYDANLPSMKGSGEEEIWREIKDPFVVHIVVRNEGGIVVAGLSYSVSERHAEIHLLAVDKHQRGTGIGRKCLQELLLILQTPSYHVPIVAVQSDLEAQGFYHRLGFTPPSDQEKVALHNDGLQRFMGTLLVRKCERLADKAKKGSDFRGGKRRRMVADDEGDNDRCV